MFRFSGQLEDDRIQGLRLELTRSDVTRELAATFESRRFHLPLRLHPDEVGEGHLTLFAELENGLLWDRGAFGIRGVDPPAPDLEVGVLAVSLLPQTSSVIPVTNRGTVALEILELRVEGPFDLVAAPASVPALTTTGVELAYSGAGGEQGTLILRTNDPVRPDVAVALSGLSAAEAPIGLQRLRAGADGVLSLDLDFSENDFALALSSGQVFDTDTQDVYGFTVGGPLVVAKPLLLPDPQTPGNAFEAALRRREAELAQRIRLHGLPVAKRTAVDYGLGDQRSFFFSEAEGVPEQVLSATVVHVNDKAVAFVDDNLRLHADNVTAAKIAEYVDRFAGDYPLVVDVFGPPSDVDGDGKIALLFTHLVDDAGPAGFFEAE